MNYACLHIIPTATALAETTERLFPVSRHRSARVRKKLLKRHGGEFKKEPAAFQVGSTVYAHPTIYAQIRRALA